MTITPNAPVPPTLAPVPVPADPAAPIVPILNVNELAHATDDELIIASTYQPDPPPDPPWSELPAPPPPPPPPPPEPAIRTRM